MSRFLPNPNTCTYKISTLLSSLITLPYFVIQPLYFCKVCIFSNLICLPWIFAMMQASDFCDNYKAGDVHDIIAVYFISKRVLLIFIVAGHTAFFMPFFVYRANYSYFSLFLSLAGPMKCFGLMGLLFCRTMLMLLQSNLL